MSLITRNYDGRNYVDHPSRVHGVVLEVAGPWWNFLPVIFSVICSVFFPCSPLLVWVRGKKLTEIYTCHKRIFGCVFRSSAVFNMRDFNSILRDTPSIKFNKYVSGLAEFRNFLLLALSGPAHLENYWISV